MDHLTVASCVAACVVICTILSIILKLGQRRHLYKQASKFPGPPTLPFIGNAHLFIGDAETVLDKALLLGKLYPAPFRLWIGNYLMIVVNNPKHLKIVLHSPKTMEKGPFYEFARPWLGTGLLTAPVTKWRPHRKLIQPTFHLTILQSFIDRFAKISAIMVKEMERDLYGQEFNIYNYTSQCALRTICETTMGVNLGTDTNDNVGYTEAFEKVTASLAVRAASPWLHPNFIFNRTQLGKDQEKNIKTLHTFTENVIQAKKDQLLENSLRPDLAENEEDTGNRIPWRKIVLEHLIEASHENETLSDEALREEVDTMMAGGSGTIGAVSASVMWMLSCHPEIQEKAYQELREIYGDNDSDVLHVTPENLKRLTYLECVIKETMRLFPTTPFLTRLVTEDLDIGEHTFPEGSLIFVPIIDIQRNEEYWPDPMKFDPDRFLPEEVKKRDTYTYLPFSGGPRACIGSKYAMMSMKILLATTLRKYILKKDKILPMKDLRFKWEVLMKPVDPITLRIERRTPNAPSI